MSVPRAPLSGAGAPADHEQCYDGDGNVPHFHDGILSDVGVDRGGILYRSSVNVLRAGPVGAPITLPLASRVSLARATSTSVRQYDAGRTTVVVSSHRFWLSPWARSTARRTLTPPATGLMTSSTRTFCPRAFWNSVLRAAAAPSRAASAKLPAWNCAYAALKSPVVTTRCGPAGRVASRSPSDCRL